jgi:hypothetical protein
VVTDVSGKHNAPIFSENTGNAFLRNYVKIGTFIRMQRLRWMGHLQRLDGARNTKKAYQANLHQEDKARWKDDVENSTRKMGIVNWGQRAQDRDGWRRATAEALFLLGMVELQKKNAPPKRRQGPTRLHGIITQKTTI